MQWHDFCKLELAQSAHLWREAGAEWRSQVTALRQGEVVLWWCPIDMPEAQLLQQQKLLSAAEQLRAAEFRLKPVRARFIAARLFLRLLLAAYLHCAPEEVEFTLEDHGKPRLAPCMQHRSQAAGCWPLVFNLSHAGDGLLCALACDGWLGVDVEQLSRKLQPLALAKRFFAAEEYGVLQQAATQAQLMQDFFRIWTLKEAFIKAIGLGLSFALQDFAVAYAGASVRAQVLRCDAQQWCHPDWNLCSLAVRDVDYMVAFAYAGKLQRVALHEIALTSILG